MTQNSSPSNDEARNARVSLFSSPRARFWMWAFIAVYCIAMISSLGAISFVGPDEPRYAQVAREMFESGDYISPRLCNLLWFEKPALFYWLAAASYHVFGANEWAARFPSAILALVTVGALWWAAQRREMARWGLLGAAILATSAIWLGFSHAATTDMVLAASIAVALLSAWLSLETEGRERVRYLLLSAACVGFAMLAKGLVGILFVVIILALHGAATRRFLFRSGREFAAALGVFLLVAGLWYIPVTLRHGDVFIQEFFVNHHFKRFLTNKYQHPQKFYYYLLVAFAGMMPWSFLIIPAIGRLRALRPRRNARDSLLALAWIWIVVVIGFFSLSTSKLPGYILPAFPALALVFAAEAERLWNGERTRVLKVAALLGALAFPMVLLGAELYLQKKGFALPGGKMFFALPLLLALGAGAAFLRGSTRSAISIPLMTVLCVLVGLNFALPQLNHSLSNRAFATRVASLLQPEEDIVFYRLRRSYAHTFYSNGRVAFYKHGELVKEMSTGDDLDIKNSAQLVQALETEMRENEPSVVFITKKKYRDDLLTNTAVRAHVIAQKGDHVALRVSLRSRITSSDATNNARDKHLR